jgi:hypothetical protein
MVRILLIIAFFLASCSAQDVLELVEICNEVLAKEHPELCQPAPPSTSTPIPWPNTSPNVAPEKKSTIPTPAPVEDAATLPQSISPTSTPLATSNASTSGTKDNNLLFPSNSPSFTDNQTISLQGQRVNALKFVGPWQWSQVSKKRLLRVTYEGPSGRYEIPFHELANPIDYPKREKLRPHFQGKSCEVVAKMIGSRVPTIYGRDAKTDEVLWTLKLPGDICKRWGVPENKKKK